MKVVKKLGTNALRQAQLSALPKQIYKFREQGIWLERLLTSHTIHFSNPFTWNDPLDTQLALDTNNTPAAIRKYILKVCNRNEMAAAQAVVDEYIADPLRWNNLINEEARKLVEKSRFCCFTTNWKSTLQWAYYAGGHTGVAIEFDPLRSPKVLLPLYPIRYLKKYPFNNYIQDPNRAFIDLLMVKSRVWRHEQEVRVWHDNIVNGHFVPTALRSITFGVNCPDNYISVIRTICHKSGLEHVVFYKASFVEHTFEIKRELINGPEDVGAQAIRPVPQFVNEIVAEFKRVKPVFVEHRGQDENMKFEVDGFLVTAQYSAEHGVWTMLQVNYPSGRSTSRVDVSYVITLPRNGEF